MTGFTLDESKARELIALAITDFDEGLPDGTELPGELSAGELPGLSADYSPREWDWSSATADLVYTARIAGVLTGPGDVEFDRFADGEGDTGYTWLLYLGGDGAPSLKLADLSGELHHLGERGETGADAALSVLREAADAGNRLMEQLSQYVANASGSAS